METKLERIADKSKNEKRPIFTSLYHLINEELLKQCHKELDGSKAVGIDNVSKKEYAENLDENIRDLVVRLKNKAYKPLPALRVYIPKDNGKMRPLGISIYEDKIVQLALKKILEAIYEPKFLNNMYGFRPNRSCHKAIKYVHKSISNRRINYIVDADIKGYHGREIFELLQNADDAYQKSIDDGNKPDEELKVNISYKNDILTIRNTGTVFNKEGILSIVQGNDSTKHGGYIGNKGTGFRSILNWANKIEIHSGYFNVEFSKKIANDVFNEIKVKEQITKQLVDNPNLYIPI